MSLVDVLQRYNLLQHVHDATHDGGNTLDLLLTPIDDAALFSRVTVHPTCFSDHYSVARQLLQPRNVPTAVKYQFRDPRGINIAAFQHDVYRLPLYDFNRATSSDDRVRPTVQQRNATYSRLTRSAQDADSTCRT